MIMDPISSIEMAFVSPPPFVIVFERSYFTYQSIKVCALTIAAFLRIQECHQGTQATFDVPKTDCHQICIRFSISLLIIPCIFFYETLPFMPQGRLCMLSLGGSTEFVRFGSSKQNVIVLQDVFIRGYRSGPI